MDLVVLRLAQSTPNRQLALASLVEVEAPAAAFHSKPF